MLIVPFSLVQSSLSPAGAYWFYSACAACAAVLGVTVLPETKVSQETKLRSKPLASCFHFHIVHLSLHSANLVYDPITCDKVNITIFYLGYQEGKD